MQFSNTINHSEWHYLQLFCFASLYAISPAITHHIDLSPNLNHSNPNSMPQNQPLFRVKGLRNQSIYGGSVHERVKQSGNRQSKLPIWKRTQQILSITCNLWPSSGSSFIDWEGERDWDGLVKCYNSVVYNIII